MDSFMLMFSRQPHQHEEIEMVVEATPPIHSWYLVYSISNIHIPMKFHPDKALSGFVHSLYHIECLEY
jgi:hypothetical protein